MPDSDRALSPSPTVAAPTIELPTGGGAIRGIGEKFGTNPVNGTGSMSVPIPTSPGRSGFGPQLALQYDSGEGNGPFGFGWALSLPAITRKTAKGLPQYDDAHESDVFILSGSEDLVPAFRLDDGGTAVCDPDGIAVVHDDRVDDYLVRRYRPRIEGLFARIERWTSRTRPGDVHWRSYSNDNILTVYGLDAESRIADPLQPAHTFSWLVSEVRDDRGNGVLYRYAAENGVGVDLARASERNRGDRDDSRRTANRYLARILYGNRVPLLNVDGRRPRFLDRASVDRQVSEGLWMFEAVFDYGGHDTENPRPHAEAEWPLRTDPFSTYRAGFEVRTARLCRRILMFHHFPDEPPVGRDCLVRSTDLDYSIDGGDSSADPVGSFLYTVTQAGYRRRGGGYLRATLPPLEFEYSQAVVHDRIEIVDPRTLADLRAGVDGTVNQWIDLYGEGIPGVLTDAGDAWYYRRNLTPTSRGGVEFGPLEPVGLQPNQRLGGGAGRFMDLAADGHPDLVVLGGPMPGFYEQTGENGWAQFRPFTATLDRPMPDARARFIDLDGDGRVDVMLTEDDAIVWHPSLGEAGFGSARRVARSRDEEKGPRLVFADDDDSVYLADVSGDGLTDLVRIRNGDISYWPNLGYGRFGRRIAMDASPRLDDADRFDQRRVRLADIDGSGTADLIYLHRDGVRLYFNHSGNGWSAPRILSSFPVADRFSTITVADLLGNGTACLVWSSALPGEAGRPMRYVDLMGGQKPHLLVRAANNLGAETRIHYVSATTFFLDDREAGHTWLTRLPFPVHVVDRVETLDWISRSRFVTRYAYHDGYFDGGEREFRGFGMVDQWDADDVAALATESAPVPFGEFGFHPDSAPVHVKTWFHTGRPGGGSAIGYFTEPGRDRPFVVTSSLARTDSADERRELYRALKGSVLRQEVYADDAGPDAREQFVARARTPYTVTERSFTVRLEQRLGPNRHAVAFVHSRETMTFHFERVAADPRVTHTLTLQVDAFGNILEEAAIAYGRRCRGRKPELAPEDHATQQRTHLSFTRADFTDPVLEDPAAYRTPVPAEMRTYELRSLTPRPRPVATGPMDFDRVADLIREAGDGAHEVPYEGLDFSRAQQPGHYRRLIEHTRTVYRSDDLTRMLPPAVVESRAISGESWRLALTAAMAAAAFTRDGDPLPLPAPGTKGGGDDDVSGYRDLAGDGARWIPSGRTMLSPSTDDSASAELHFAERHFFTPRRVIDPFGAVTTLTFDRYDLLLRETRDALGNRVTAGERNASETDGHPRPTATGNDYRVLKPALVMDANRNRTQIAFDALGMVAGTAARGKPGEQVGDSLAGFDPDLTERRVHAIVDRPPDDPQRLLGDASMRVVADPFAFHRTKHRPHPDPVVVYVLARDTHASDVRKGRPTSYTHVFSYIDGFGREIQKKSRAEPDPRDELATPRWIASGWQVFDDKGRVVRRFEPFFSRLGDRAHRFEYGVRHGVSSVMFYDPLGRLVCTLHPDHSYDKVVIGPWGQSTWDANDTVDRDPRTDDDIAALTSYYFAEIAAHPNDRDWLTWRHQRVGGALGRDERRAALATSAHADTPAVSHVDALGRTVLTVADNGPGEHAEQGHRLLLTRVHLDIEGNREAVYDAVTADGRGGRLTTRSTYDMTGRTLFVRNIDTGARWTFCDITGSPLSSWDSRAHVIRTDYDLLRRRVRTRVAPIGAPRDAEQVAERLVYGEQHPSAELHNLRGRLYLHLDQAGAATTDDIDFEGNPHRVERRMATDYKHTIDWHDVDDRIPADATRPLPAGLDDAVSAVLDAERYQTVTEYDALKRPIQLSDTRRLGDDVVCHITQPSYNEAGLLRALQVWLDRDEVPDEILDPDSATVHAVEAVWYDARGRRMRIDYGNGTRTAYEYDRDTFRLTRSTTKRVHGKPQSLHDLQYVYDPVGNVVAIRDDVHATVYFRNQRAEPGGRYTYDALYRLIEASGREHVGQLGDRATPGLPDVLGARLATADDGYALAAYTERYDYDDVGNLLRMRHRGRDRAHPGWTRRYDYDTTDGQSGARTNRLTSTSTGRHRTRRYRYDAHGNLTHSPELGGADGTQNLQWNVLDELIRVQLEDGAAYYVYDASGQRMRKVRERSDGTVEDRVYFARTEFYRRVQGTRVVERASLHVSDAGGRVALIETRLRDTAGTDDAPQRLVRFQLADHLGSSRLELDDRARLISYEEYTPYGVTSVQAVRSHLETPKRYRFTGKERDEESGFDYFGGRYYASSLARWTAADPSNATGTPSPYGYVNGNPVVLVDPDGREDQEFFKVDDQKTDRERIADAVGLVIPPVAIARGLFATLTGQVSTDYLVPGIGSLAVIMDETPRLGYKAAETVDLALQGEGKKALRSAIDTGVHGQNVGFALLPFLTEVGRRAPSPTKTAPVTPTETAPPPVADQAATKPAPVAPNPVATANPKAPPPPPPPPVVQKPPLLVQVEIKPVGGEGGGWRQLEQPTRSSYGAIGIITEGGGYEGVATYDRVTGKVELKVSRVGEGAATAKTYQIGQFTPAQLADFQAKSGGNTSTYGNLVEAPIRKMISDATGQAVSDPGKNASKTGVDWRPVQPPLPYAQ